MACGTCHGIAHSTDYWRNQRWDLDAVRATETVFPDWGVSRQRRGFVDALFVCAVDGGRFVLDFGRFDEYGDGAVSGDGRR